MTTDIAWGRLPLPEDVERMKAAGFFDDCRSTIQTYLAGELTEGMRRRLELELERLDFLPESEYPYADAEALELLDETFTDFAPEELPELVRSRAADWLYFRGVRRFHRRFIENIITTRPDYAARQKNPSAESLADVERKKRLAENLRLMPEKGQRKAKMTLELKFWLKPEAVRPGETLKVHLPLPRSCGHQSEIEILELSHPDGAVIAPEDAPQRTVCFPVAPAGDVFSVKYSFVNTIPYHSLPERSASFAPGEREKLAEYLTEEPPHVLFTPLMKEISKEIQGGETNPLKLARNAYDFVTTQVKYSYMRHYAALDNICDYAGRNLKGDCGVQAILFITLCRLAGVPARWQSGLCADPAHVGPHDWAEFYIPGLGWLYADPSYGGGAYRAGDLDRWNYYFGNLDIYRMVANGEMQSQFTPPKEFFRADPTDNQTGEAEYPHRGLLPEETDYHYEMVEFEEL